MKHHYALKFCLMGWALLLAALLTSPAIAQVTFFETKLTASDAEVRDFFGFSAAIDDDTLVVGSPLDDDACPDNPNCNSGAAFVYERE